MKKTQIKNNMGKFNFVIAFVLLHEVMYQIDYACKTLQNVYINIHKATTVLQRISLIKEFRNSYYPIKSEACGLAEQWDYKKKSIGETRLHDVALGY